MGATQDLPAGATQGIRGKPVSQFLERNAALFEPRTKTSNDLIRQIP